MYGVCLSNIFIVLTKTHFHSYFARGESCVITNGSHGRFFIHHKLDFIVASKFNYGLKTLLREGL